MKEQPTEAERPAWWERALIRVTPSCQTVTRIISESFERRLTPRERIQLRLHYTICVWCLRFQQQLRLLHEGVARNSAQFAEAAGSLSNVARERIQAQIADELASVSPVSAGSAAHAPGRWLLRFALVPVAAFILALGSRWCIHCVEFEHVGGALIHIAHAILSWPYIAGHALGIVTETPEGFPLCCFIGWSGAGLLAVALWAWFAHFAAHGRMQHDHAQP